MKTTPLRKLIFAFCSILMLISCGGSGGPRAGGGIGGTGIISSGTVAAYGSIFVNGTEFDTSDAVIIVNGENVGTGDQIARNYLDIGKVVLVEGTGDMDDIFAVANRVTHTDNVAGPVESIIDKNGTSKEIVVLGQDVILNVLTKFKKTAFDTIALDDLVAVSGLVDDAGAIRATFLEKTGEFIPGNIVGVSGFIVNLDLNLKTFRINNLTVDYEGAMIIPAALDLAEDLLVEVEGTLDAAGGVMRATTIELGDEIDEADQIEVLGFVTYVESVFEFTVGNQKVQVDANTLFVDGDPTDIVSGAKLEAEGYLEGGILFADEVEFWDPDQIELEGEVTYIASDSEFTVWDRVQEKQLVVQTDAGTVFDPEDLSLYVGMKIEIKGVPVDIAHSVIVADKVSFEED
jgi:hypothetical protein